MRIIVQRVSEASLTIESKVVGEIRKGLMVLVGIEESEMTKMEGKRKKRKVLGARSVYAG